MIDSSLFDRLKEERKRLKLRQEDAAGIAGCTRESWSRYENGLMQPGTDFWVALARHGFNVQYILAGVDEPNKRMSESLCGVNAVIERMRKAAGNPWEPSYTDLFDVSQKEIDSWFKQGRVRPDFLANFAAHWGVRLDELMYGEAIATAPLQTAAENGGVYEQPIKSDEAALLPDEAALLDNYRHSPPDAQAILRATGAACAQQKTERVKPKKGRG